MDILQAVLGWFMTLPGEALVGAGLTGVVMSKTLRRFIMMLVGLLLFRLTNALAGKMLSTKTGWTVIGLVGTAVAAFMLSDSSISSLSETAASGHDWYGAQLQGFGMENPAWAQFGTYAILAVVAFVLMRKLVSNTAELGSQALTKVNNSPATGGVILGAIALVALGAVGANDLGTLDGYIPPEIAWPACFVGLIYLIGAGITQIKAPGAMASSLKHNWVYHLLMVGLPIGLLGAAHISQQSMPEGSNLPMVLGFLGVAAGLGFPFSYAIPKLSRLHKERNQSEILTDEPYGQTDAGATALSMGENGELTARTPIVKAMSGDDFQAIMAMRRQERFGQPRRLDTDSARADYRSILS